MQAQLSAEKTAIISRKLTRPSLEEVFQRHPGLQSVRRKILLLLLFDLVVMTSYLILQMITLALDHNRSAGIETSILIELFITVVLIIYLIGFMIVLTEYFPIAIFIFACLTLVQLTSGFVLLIFAIMAMVVSLSLINTVGIGIVLDVLYITVAILTIGLSASIIVSSFNLRRLMKT